MPDHMPISRQTFADWIAMGREQSGVEFKGPGPFNSKHLLGKVMRAMIAMANHRDGGYVVLGVDEPKEQLILTGLSQEHRDTWAYSTLADKLSSYADPAVTFILSELLYQDRLFLILEVDEFADLPILCKKRYDSDLMKDGKKDLLLREGACYVRSRYKPESAEVRGQTEMRELLDLATVKALRRCLSATSEAGGEVRFPTERPAKDQFEEQLHGALGGLGS